ncbi:MAG TPA: LPS export ABC transporter permease LptF [Candidatus Binataceae bacterium]|nr:LPS export ABC transporter permease LptF [Candidatus Binataceae bacterium]
MIVRSKILDRYVAREVAVPIAISLGVITLVLVVARLLKLIDLIVNQGVAATEVLALLGYLMPSLIALSLPMAVLLGTMLGIGRLSGDQEIIAARACGVSFGRIALPVIVVAAAIYPIEMLTAMKIAPAANVKLRGELVDLMHTRATAGLPEKVFNRNFDGMVVYFDRAEPPGTKLVNVLISDNRNPSARSIIFARSGLLVPHPGDLAVTMRLRDGWIYGGDKSRDARHVVQFDTYDIAMTPKEGLRYAQPLPLELTTVALWHQIKRARHAGHPDIPAEIEMAHRWTIPIAIFPFALLGMTLGLTPVRGGRSERFAFALMLFFVYYVLMRAGEAFAQAHVIETYVGASVPDLLFIAIAIAPFRRTVLDRGEHGESISYRLRRWMDGLLPGAGAAS